MDFRLISRGWEAELTAAPDSLRIVCPFVKDDALRRLLSAGDAARVEVITRFNLADFGAGVSASLLCGPSSLVRECAACTPSCSCLAALEPLSRQPTSPSEGSLETWARRPALAPE